MSSDRLISELKEAFDRLDEIEQQLAERKSSVIRVKTTTGEVVNYSFSKIADAISNIFQELEASCGVGRFINDFYDKNKIYSYIAIRYQNCIFLLKTENSTKQKLLRVTISIVLKLRLFIFKNLNMIRNFQFIEPRLHHAFYDKGL